MSRFKDLSLNKTKLLQSLYEDDNLVKCLVSNSSDFLSYDISGFDRTTLLYSQLFPFKTVVDIATNPLSYITMNFKFRPEQSGITFKASNITFFIITHKSIIRTDVGLRTDYCIGRIDDLINLSRIVGISKMKFDDMGDFTVDKDGNWIGTSISYKSIEFN